MFCLKALYMLRYNKEFQMHSGMAEAWALLLQNHTSKVGKVARTPEKLLKRYIRCVLKRHSQTCTLSKTHILPCILIHNATAKRIWWKRRSILCKAVCLCLFFYIKKNWFGYFLFYSKNQINKTESTELFIEKLFSSTLTFQGKE